MSLFSILSNSAAALNTQQGVAAVASNNLDNVDTVGYARQTANLDSASLNVLGGVVLGGGVSIGSVTQTRDRFIEAQLPGAMGQSSYSQAQTNSLSSIDALNTSNPGGLTQTLSGFWAAMQALSQDAGNSSLRSAAVSAATLVASSFNTTASALTAAQSGLDTQVSSSIAQINSLSAQMAQLNKQIRGASVGGQQPNELLDARQAIQDQLVALTGAHPITDAQGDVSLALPGGDALVSADGSATLTAAPDASNSGHISLSLMRTDGTGPVSVPDASVGGQVGGWLQVRDGTLAATLSSLDTLASQFSTAVNAAHSAGYALDGSTGRDLFTTGATVAGSAASIAVNSDIAADPTLLATKSSASAGSGDATGLQTLIAVQNNALASGQTPSSALATLTAQFGSSAQHASATAAQDQTALTHLTTLRASASGVSSDQELVNMQRAQSAYQAISKVISTTQTMLDTLLAIPK